MFQALRPLKILASLGEGLNANVYKVSKYQPSLKVSKVFALKVLKRSEDINHFKTEFESLLQASGKHIVKYRGWETYKSKPALLLEYIEGTTLHSLLNRYKLTKDEAAWIYQETSAGLYELSESGLFHGDLSPKNIMVDINGNIKLIDFGLTNWRTKKIELTPEFAAESVLSGEKPSLESDIISLNRIFLQFNLVKPEIFNTPKPQSLAQKVTSLQNTNLCQTASLETTPSTPITRKIKKRLLITASCLFMTPVSAQNSSKIEHEIIVRSSQWMAVKSSKSDEWCFTPCSLKFKKTGLQTIYWKNSSKTATSQIYIDQSQKFLNIKRPQL
ncbi:MAG: protein kinase family protein [Bdellovibrionales bacterium]